MRRSHHIGITCGVMGSVGVVVSGAGASQLGDGYEGRGTPTVHTWDQPVSGFWFDPSRWDTGIVPSTHADTAVFDLYDVLTATIDADVFVGGLRIEATPIRVALAPGIDLTINSELVNRGKIIVNDQSGEGVARLRVWWQADTTGSAGEIYLGGINDPSEAVLEALGGTMINMSAIRGSGVLRGDFENHGTIWSFEQQTPGYVLDGSITQSRFAEVRVSNGALELMPGSSLIGGEFELRFGSLILHEDTLFEPDVIELDGDTILDIRGRMKHPFPSQPTESLYINGFNAACILTEDYTNNGEIVLHQSDDAWLARLVAEGNVTIDGTGIVHLREPSIPVRAGWIGTEGAYTMTFGSGQMIYGTGEIDGDRGGAVVIFGTVRTSPGGRILLDGEIRGGAMFADNGSIEVITSKLINAQLLTENGGTLSLYAGELVNPVIRSSTPVLAQSNGGLRISGSAIVDADLIVRRDSSTGAGLALEFLPGSFLSGGGEIVLDGDNAGLGGDITIPESFTLHGCGYIDGDIVNRSTITATSDLHPLTLRGTYREGVYIADRGDLHLNGTHIDGEYIARGGLVRIASGSFVNSHVYATEGGEIRLAPGARTEIENSLIETDLDLCLGAWVAFIGNSRIDGFHRVLDGSSLIFDDGRLEGNGTIFMRANPAAYTQPSIFARTGTGVVSEGFTIRGSGRLVGNLDGSLICEGDVIADDPFAPLVLDGTLGPIANLVVEGGSLELDGGLRLMDTVIPKGTQAGVTLGDGTVTFERVENRIEIVSPNGNSVVQVNEELINNGTIIIGSDALTGGSSFTFPEFAAVLGDGVVRLQSMTDLVPARIIADDVVRFGPGQRVEGDGRFYGEVLIEGTLAPGGESRLIRTATTEFAPSATLEIDVFDNGESDLLSSFVNTQTRINGTLELVFADGYTPSFGDGWQIIVRGRPSGLFREIGSNISLENGWSFVQINSNEGVRVVLSCPGDRDGNGQRDFFDVFDFITSFEEERASADLNFDGNHDFYDVAAYIELYSRECTP